MSLERQGKNGRRTRTGCLTCRRRHYKCDENIPKCFRCLKSSLGCVWPLDEARHDVSIHKETLADLLQGTRSTSTAKDHGIDLESLENEKLSSVLLSTKQSDQLNYLIGQFYNHSFHLCTWTKLLELPRRSNIPNLLFARKRNFRRMTNWANFYLPHLAHGTMDDSLSLAIAAYVAARMQDKVLTVAFYVRVLQLLRQLLRRPDCAHLDNQDFMRIWATTLLLAKLEDELGNVLTQAQHTEGATTLALIAYSRFSHKNQTATTDSFEMRSIDDQLGPDAARLLLSSDAAVVGLELMHDNGCRLKTTLTDILPTSNHVTATGDDLIPTSRNSCSVPLAACDSPMNDRPLNEFELPRQLLNLTRRLRHASLLCNTMDIDWPSFTPTSDQTDPLAELLKKSAECYAHTIPLVEDFHAEQFRLDASGPAYNSLLERYRPRYLASRECLDAYDTMLQSYNGPEHQVFLDEEHGFPFNPRITFANLQFAQPYAITHVFLVLLAPFLDNSEHSKAVQTWSAILAELQSNQDSWLNAAWPDLFIAAFWRPGAERVYFADDMRRRKGDWARVINRIWHRIDTIADYEARVVTKEEILSIALFEYRQIYFEGFKLQHTPTWQTQGILTLSWAWAVGMPDPCRSRFASQKEKDERQNWPNIRRYQHRITVFRENKGHVLNLNSVLEQLVLQPRSESSTSGSSSLSSPNKLYTYEGLDKYESWIESDDQQKPTETGTIASELFRHDVDNDKIFYIM